MLTRRIPVRDLEVDPVSVVPTPTASPQLVRKAKEGELSAPLTVRPLGDGYGVLAGTDRHLAADLAGVGKVPCEVREELEGDDLEAMKVSFRETAADVGPWMEQRVVGRVHEAAGRSGVEMTAEQLGVPEATVERNLLIRGLPRHVRLRLKRPWNLTENERRVLADASLVEAASFHPRFFSPTSAISGPRAFFPKSKSGGNSLPPNIYRQIQAAGGKTETSGRNGKYTDSNRGSPEDILRLEKKKNAHEKRRTDPETLDGRRRAVKEAAKEQEKNHSKSPKMGRAKLGTRRSACVKGGKNYE